MTLFQKIWQFFVDTCPFTHYARHAACLSLPADGFHQAMPQPTPQKKIHMTQDEFVDHLEKRLPKFKHVHGAARRKVIVRVIEDVLETTRSNHA
jgi:hypothetical protein